jgi:hypothetical protein
LKDGAIVFGDIGNVYDEEVALTVMQETNWDVYQDSVYVGTIPLSSGGTQQILAIRTGDNSFTFSNEYRQVNITLLSETTADVSESGKYQIQWASGAIDEYEFNIAYSIKKITLPPEPTPTPDPTPTPEPTPVPAPDPDPNPTPEPTPTPAPEPVPSPEPIPIPEPIPTPTPVPIPVPIPTPTLDEVLYESRIDGAFNGWGRDTVIVLMNNTAWRQALFHYEYKYAYSPKVTISKRTFQDYAFVQYYAFVEGTREKVPVREVTNFFKSSIRGQFSGWKGDTIIELQDGTKWQQDEYEYTIDIELSPDVVIFQDGISFYAFIEGTDEAVRVKKID